MDNAHTAKASSWKSFVNKGVKKGKKGFSKGESMFKTPDGVDGRVGVVGSGRGMTEYDDSVRETQAKRMRRGE